MLIYIYSYNERVVSNAGCIFE